MKIHFIIIYRMHLQWELLLNVSMFFQKAIDIYEILPHKKSKFQVLRLYGIQLGNVIIISGSAIKLTQTMDEHPLIKREKIKIRSLQDFLRDNEINDEESFFDYLSQQD